MDVTGLKDLLNIFNRSKRNFKKESYAYLNRVGTRFLRKVKLRTPVDTGRLRRGWNIEEGYYRVSIYNDVGYGPHVEHGHRTKGGNYVEGRYMLKTTVEEIEKDLDEEFEIFIGNLWE